MGIILGRTGWTWGNWKIEKLGNWEVGAAIGNYIGEEREDLEKLGNWKVGTTSGEYIENWEIEDIGKLTKLES